MCVTSWAGRALGEHAVALQSSGKVANVEETGPFANVSGTQASQPCAAHFGPGSTIQGGDKGRRMTYEETYVADPIYMYIKYPSPAAYTGASSIAKDGTP